MVKTLMMIVSLVIVLLFVSGCSITGDVVNEEVLEPDTTELEEIKELKGRKMFKEYEEAGVTFETDSKAINEYTNAVNIGKRERVDTTEYLTFTKPNIIRLANDLRAKAEEKGEQPYEYIIKFVQSLGYRFDDTVGFDEFPKYPEETLYEGNGDCEDTSYVLYSLLEALGYDVTLILFPTHMMVGLACEDETDDRLCGKGSFPLNRKKYYPIETTSEGWKLGATPKNLKGVKALLIKNEGTEEFRALKCRYKEEKEIRNITKTVKTVKYRDVKKPCKFENSDVNSIEKNSGITEIFDYGLHYCEVSFTLTNTNDVYCYYDVELKVGDTNLIDNSFFLSAGGKKKFKEIYDCAGGEEVSDNAKLKISPGDKTVKEKYYVEKKITEPKVYTILVKECY